MPNCLFYSIRKPNGHGRQIRFNSHQFLDNLKLATGCHKNNYLHLAECQDFWQVALAQDNISSKTEPSFTKAPQFHFGTKLIQLRDWILWDSNYCIVVGITSSGSRYDELSLSHFSYNIRSYRGSTCLIFHSAELLAKELWYTLLDVDKDDKYLSTSLLAIKSVHCVCSTPIMWW